MSDSLNESPERFDLRSHSIVDQRRQEILRLFPEVRTEGGLIDFDRLKVALGEIVDTGKERYGMVWPGKSDCIKTIQSPSIASLRPVPEFSIRWDFTKNLVIEGDNLEVLKLMQKAYLSQIRVIFIDPPYNTGGDFIYPDDYSESLQTYLEYTGQADNEGRRYGTNTEADGRFHSKWLNMIYPRLYLARNLLTDDGVIFITIDDGEVDNLRKACYEVFGEDNFVAQIEWQKRYTRSNNTDDFTSVIDHIVVFSKSEKFKPQLAEREEEANARYLNPDNDPRGPWKAVPFLNPLSPEERPNLVYPITHPDGRVLMPSKKAWRSEEAVWRKLVEENRVWWGKDGDGETPNVKRFLSEVRQGMTPINFWDHEFAGHTDAANQELKEIFGDKVFDTPKPIKLIQRMLQLAAPKDEPCVVLDFFAGSGSTAHAVLDLNQKDGGRRQFILVQLPEKIDSGTFNTVADITRERVKHVCMKLASTRKEQLDFDQSDSIDTGFRFFRLDESNFTSWNAGVADDAKAIESQLELHIDHIREGRSSDDILYELLLKSGFSLSTPVENQSLAGKTIYSVAGGALIICLENELTLELIRAIAELKPERVVCLDQGFAGNDQLKANAVQTFKTKGITSFKTV